MTTTISQETFDKAVQENMEEFDMNFEEAVDDAKTQFQTQGVNLYNIIFSKSGVTEPEIVTTLKQLDAISTENLNFDEKQKVEAIIKLLESLDTQLCIDIAHQLAAANNKALPILVALFKMSVSSSTSTNQQIAHSVTSLILLCWTHLIRNNPDAMKSRTELDQQANWAPLLHALSCDATFLNSADNKQFIITQLEIISGVLEVLCEACSKHEANRAYLFATGMHSELIEKLLLAYVVPQISSNKANVGGEADTKAKTTRFIHTLCRLVRIFASDDDIREVAGNAHENAKQIFMETRVVAAFDALMQQCSSSESDSPIIADVFNTMEKLTVRNEFCDELLNSGFVDTLIRILSGAINDKKVFSSGCNLLRRLLGSDVVKRAIFQKSTTTSSTGCANANSATAAALPVLVEALQRWSRNPADYHVTHLCLASLDAITLRQPEICRHLVCELQLAGILVATLQVHVTARNFQVVRYACKTVRNCVARTRDLAEKFLAHECLEPLLREASQLRNEDGSNSCEDETKSALRDLDLHLDLKESWKGEKGSLAN